MLLSSSSGLGARERTRWGSSWGAAIPEKGDGVPGGVSPAGFLQLGLGASAPCFTPTAEAAPQSSHQIQIPRPPRPPAPGGLGTLTGAPGIELAPAEALGAQRLDFSFGNLAGHAGLAEQNHAQFAGSLKWTPDSKAGSRSTRCCPRNGHLLVYLRDKRGRQPLPPDVPAVAARACAAWTPERPSRQGASGRVPVGAEHPASAPPKFH